MSLKEDMFDDFIKVTFEFSKFTQSNCNRDDMLKFIRKIYPIYEFYEVNVDKVDCYKVLSDVELFDLTFNMKNAVLNKLRMEILK